MAELDVLAIARECGFDDEYARAWRKELLALGSRIHLAALGDCISLLENCDGDLDYAIFQLKGRIGALAPRAAGE